MAIASSMSKVLGRSRQNSMWILSILMSKCLSFERCVWASVHARTNSFDAKRSSLTWMTSTNVFSGGQADALDWWGTPGLPVSADHCPLKALTIIIHSIIPHHAADVCRVLFLGSSVTHTFYSEELASTALERYPTQPIPGAGPSWSLLQGHKCQNCLRLV
jgi:hypothetical protein